MSNENYKYVPYYLKPIETDIDDVVKELKTWSKNSNLNFHNDKTFKNLFQQLKDIQNKILFNSNADCIKNTNLCSQGLDLSVKLCEYCISHKYDTLEFIKRQTKYFFDYFSDQLEHWTIYSGYKKAMLLEQAGDFENCINVYLDVLKNHYPTGSAYYTSPFYLSMQLFNFNDALKIYNYLKQNIKKTENSNLVQTLNEFSNLLQDIPSSENLYPCIKLKLSNIIKSEPGILQTEIYKKFPDNYKECLRNILYYLNKSELIKREKQGRSYRVYINQNIE